jgi:hypothetical protein
VAVWNHGDGWSVLHCRMVEFLVRLFCAELDRCPIAGTSVWGNTSPRFLHVREEMRLREAGLDPWTGEPDPCAGMFE